MAMKYLSKTLDIHTGGVDHIDIHHTNEIAQSESATGKKFVRYWLHCNFLMVEGQKMSKSLGNIITLEDIEKRGFKPLAFRYLVLNSHYRSLMNFTWQAIESAEKAYENLLEHISAFSLSNKINKKLEKEIKEKILTIINDDLDTPKLIAEMWSVLRTNKDLNYKKTFVILADQVLGLGLEEFLKKQKISTVVKKKVLLREKLRKEKKWSEADQIREEILKMGYKIEDTPYGPVIKKIIK
jgi:cysteinyl-tRNA synthetase